MCKVKKRFDFLRHRGVKQAVAAAEKELDGTGRVLLRASGTEPLIRVMVEGKPHPGSSIGRPRSQKQ